MKKELILFGCLFSFVFLGNHAQAKDPSIDCIESICGSKAKIGSTFIVSDEFYNLAKNKIAQTLEKPLANYMGRVIHESMLKDQLLQNFLKLPTVAKPDAKLLAFAQAFTYLKKFNTFAPALETIDGKYTFNEQKLKTLFPAMLQNELDAILSFNYFIDDYLRLYSIYSNPLPVALKMRFGDIPILEAQKTIALKTLEAYRNFVLQFPYSEKIVTQNPTIRKAAEGKILPFTEQEILRKEFQNIIVIKGLSNPLVLEKFAALPLNIDEFKDQFRLIYEGSQLRKTFQNKTSIKTIYSEAFQKCQKSLFNSYAFLPSEQQLSEFSSVITQVKSTALQVVEERKNMSVKDQFNFEILLPNSRENFLNEFALYMNDRKDETQQFIGGLKAVSLPEDIFNTGFLGATVFSDESILKSTVEACDQFKPTALDDKTYLDYKMINVSWSSVQVPELGASILAHEIGHQVDKLFAADVTQEKLCLQQKQGSEKYLAEDFADLFSAEVMKRMNYQLNGKPVDNMGCALLSSENGEFTQGFLKNTSDSDTHSSGFFRLIAFSAMTSGITNQCQQFLTTSSETKFDNYCRWQK